MSLDFSGMTWFWRVVDILRRDDEPAPEVWAVAVIEWLARRATRRATHR